jgi:hypothetical protein
VVYFVNIKIGKIMAVFEIENGVLKKCILADGGTQVTIPDNVTSIGRGAFRGCAGLTSVIIPDSVTSIDARAFQGCRNLISVTIPGSVMSIGARAFQGCTGLTEIKIPDCVTSIGDGVFLHCTGLTSISIPGLIENIAYLTLQDQCVVTRRALLFMPTIRGSLATVSSRFSLAEIAVVRCMLLVENRLQALPIELWTKILSFSQHEYIPSKTVRAVGAESLRHSNAERQQITAYNNHIAIWEGGAVKPSVISSLLSWMTSWVY